jgi:tol-pal system protein YbgF
MKRVLILGLLAGPVILSAQRREELQSIQRDVAQLQEQVKQLQRSQDERMAALQSMLQQAVDASTKVSSGLTTLQREVDAKLTAQQDKLNGPVAVMGTKVDQMSDDFRSVSTNVAELLRRMGAMDAKLADMSSAIRTLSTPPAAPPAVPGAGSTGPPPGVSAESSYQNAYRDYSSAKYELALQEFAEYLKYFPETENAPSAQFYMGYIYLNGEQYDDAVKAFDAVLDRFPENPKTPEALYYKGVALMKGGQRTDAGTAFKDFVKRYPRSEHVSQAHVNLRVLGLERSPGKKR